MGLGGVVGMHVGLTPLYSDFHLWEEEGEKNRCTIIILARGAPKFPNLFSSISILTAKKQFLTVGVICHPIFLYWGLGLWIIDRHRRHNKLSFIYKTCFLQKSCDILANRSYKHKVKNGTTFTCFGRHRQLKKEGGAIAAVFKMTARKNGICINIIVKTRKRFNDK